MAALTVEALKLKVIYDPVTGLFTRKTSRFGQRAVMGGKAASGYILIGVGSGRYLAHRLAWLYVHGVWPDPDKVIDHINRDRSDNRICNLREATGVENARNTKRLKDVGC